MIRSFLQAKAGGGDLMLDPLLLPGLELYLRSDTGVFTDAAGTAPAGNGSAVQFWKDLSPFQQNVTQAVAAAKPVYQFAATPNGSPAIRFGDANASTQLGWQPGVNRFLSTANGFTLYMYFNCNSIDNVGCPGQIFFDQSLGTGWRFDQQFVTGAPPSITALEYSPGSFGLTVPDLGWEQWVVTAQPPINVGPLKIFKNGVQVGPTSGTYGPLTTTSWNLLLQDRFLVSGNPVGNVWFRGFAGYILLFSRFHDANTIVGVTRFLKGKLG